MCLWRGGVKGHGWQTSVLQARPGRAKSVDAVVATVLRGIANGFARASGGCMRIFTTIHPRRTMRGAAGATPSRYGEPVIGAPSAQFASGGSANARE